MPGVEIKKVKAEDDGMRLNRWFMKYYPNLTLGRLQKLLRTKQIKVDGKRAETSLKLAAGSEVRVPPMDEQPEIVRKFPAVMRSLFSLWLFIKTTISLF